VTTARAGLRAGAAVLWVAALAGPVAPGVFAATTFDQPTATATYGSSVEFTQPVTTTAAMKRVEILLDLPSAEGPDTIEVEGATRPGRATLRYSLDATAGLLPNTTIKARWRLTAANGTVEIGPSVTVRYDDTRFNWKVRAGDIVRVHWYQGSDAFGQRALAIGDKAIRDTSQLLGVTETESVDFFVYADQQAFYQALGPGTRENVGGQANAEIRTLFALITPDQIDADWVGIVIRHELTHLVFNTAADNPYHFPPRWLNEGLAVYLSQGYDAVDRSQVTSAARDGTLIPLDALAGDFPTSRDRFFLAYAESVSSIDYLVRTYGRDVLVTLIKSYASGVTDDEALTAALGVDVASFDTAWRAELKAKQPTVRGPQPAPAGPLPPGWTQADGSTGAPLGSPGPATTAVPAPSAASAPSSPGTTTDRGSSTLPIIIAVLAIIVVLGAIAYSLTRSGRSPVAMVPSEPPADEPTRQEPPQ
jgi:peptidase MA superfamily protein